MVRDAAYLAAIERRSQPNEIDRVPAITEADRAGCEAWLKDMNFLVPGNDDKTWEIIQRNWVSFLSATSTTPDATLAPDRKAVRFHSGTENETTRKERFQEDYRQHLLIQATFWFWFDGIEAMVQRWPPKARALLNNEDVMGNTESFQTLVPDWKIAQRRRYQSIWINLISFIAYCSEENALEEMGLKLDESQIDDVLDVRQEAAMIYTKLTGIKRKPEVLLGLNDKVQAFIANALAKRASTARNNPLLWWIAVLARSAVGGERDFISQGRLDKNPLPMDIDFRGRIRALVHIHKLIICHHSISTWEERDVWKVEVAGDLNSVDMTWIIGEDRSRAPKDSSDRRDCQSQAWQAILGYIRRRVQENLGGIEGTAMHKVRQLQRQIGLADGE
ncbi:hypothetical protein HOO65_030015 [Ceratocystis lukuohia]|uniref:Uncharacterized protein n=1 Tax=Ceratocystis lukuohia TaxID=2019550 RepID=A0ABR4MJW6_9PEZI